MKLRFLELPPEERHLYIEQAALQRNVSPVVLEKDFWSAGCSASCTDPSSPTAWYSRVVHRFRSFG